MKNKTTKILAVFILLFVLLLGYYGGSSSLEEDEEVKSEEENLTVAACPTFHYMLDDLEKEGISVIKSGSTGESINFVERGVADLFISGRALKPNEPDFSYEIVGPGFSFIFQEEIVVSEEEMIYISFYTDLPLQKVREEFPYLGDNLTKVDNVYKYLNNGIGITSVENTDYKRSNPVHVFGLDGGRVRLSRTPVFYYKEGPESVSKIKEIIKEDS